MYRTEDWYLERKNSKLKYPVCILSYNRPDAPIFSKKSKFIGAFAKDEVFVFIRDTQEQKQKYTYLSDKVTLVTLSDVTDVGTTRQAVVEWAYKNGHKKIFMLDDRITDICFLAPKDTKNGKVGLAKSVWCSNPHDGLIVWEKILDDYGFTISCPSHKGFSWYPENINAEYSVNNGNCAACIALDIEDLMLNNIKYTDTAICGHDDAAIMMDILKAGLPSCKITDLEYDEVNSAEVSGGGTHGDNTDLMSRCNQRNAKFYSYEGLDIKAKNEQVYLRKQNGGIYPYFKWKYWQKFYEENKTK